MKKEPFTNEQMKDLVGHYLTDVYDTYKYSITGFTTNLADDVEIIVEGAGGVVRYDAVKLMEDKYTRIDSSDGRVPWNAPDIEKEIESLIRQSKLAMRDSLLIDKGTDAKGDYVHKIFEEYILPEFEEFIYKLVNEREDNA